MKITVITVCHNSASTVADTLRSITVQSHPDIEHIVIDGGSSDDTLSIVRTLGSRVTTIVSEPDQGIYDAMNKGLQLATGDFVGFLNADDTLATPESLANIAKAAAQSVDVVYGDVVYVDPDETSKVIRYWNSGRFAARRLRYGWMPPHPTFYVRRALQNVLGLFDVQLRIAADYDFMLRILSRSGIEVAYVPRVLVRMRVGGASNKSLRAVVNKSREDLLALRKNKVGGWSALVCKNLRKLPQFALRRATFDHMTST